MFDFDTRPNGALMQEALAWAAQHVCYRDCLQVTDTPWGATLHLSGDEGTAYLKVLPADDTTTIRASEIAAEFAAGHAPDVLAHDATRGFLLLEDHRARHRPNPHDGSLLALIGTMARLQARSALSAVPDGAQRLEPRALIEAFRAFCTPSETQPAPLANFIGDAEAGFYLAMLDALDVDLAIYLGAALALPPCLNHSDLHARNAALGASGEVRIHDWDVVFWGPAGLSLTGLAVAPAGLVAGTDAAGRFDGAESDAPEALVLEAWIQALDVEGYAGGETLRRAMMPALMMGILQGILAYRRFMPKSTEDLAATEPHMRQLLRVLRGFATLIAAQSPRLAARLAALFSQAARSEELALLLHRAEDVIGLPAGQLVPRGAQARNVARVLGLNTAMREALRPDICPTLPSHPENLQGTQEQTEFASIGADLFRTHGCLALADLFPTALIDSCLAHTRTHGSGATGIPLPVGDKRAMTAQAVQGPFNDPALYAASPLKAILDRVLGTDWVIGSFTLVTSEPGAGEQHLHIDHAQLYPEMDPQPEAPAFAVTVLIPLVDIDADIGGTHVLKGSHKAGHKDGQKMPRQAARLSRGSCLMFDYRLFHSGERNAATRDRPVLSIVFHRRWFRDASNFDTQAPLQIRKSALEQVPLAHRNLFEFAHIIEDSTG